MLALTPPWPVPAPNGDPPCVSASSASAGWARTWFAACVRDGHEIVAYNRTPEKTREIATEGAEAAFSIAELVAKLAKPRAVWIMVPAGDATEAQIDELLEHLEPGDTIIDGGNTNFHDDVRRQAALAEKGIGYVDAGTSGGIWGLQVGYCLMVGGERRVREAARADLPRRSRRRAATSTSVGPAPGTT